MANSNLSRTTTSLSRTASGAQKAIIGLLLTEHDYEMYDFERFFLTLGNLCDRFDAIRDCPDTRAQEAVMIWDASVEQLADVLGLVRRSTTAEQALADLGAEADKYLVRLRCNDRAPIINSVKEEGEYWLVPKRLFHDAGAEAMSEADDQE